MRQVAGLTIKRSNGMNSNRLKRIFLAGRSTPRRPRNGASKASASTR